MPRASGLNELVAQHRVQRWISATRLAKVPPQAAPDEHQKTG
jgi:hypothetical protein